MTPILRAERFDRSLGDPNDPDAPFSYRRSAELDRREEFPAAMCDRLDELGLPRHYVPSRLGGALEDYETLMMMVRILTRRDFTVALAHGKTYLGSACVWVGGREEQAKELAAQVIGGARVSLALTEREHGSDLLAGETRAVADSGGYLLSGEKWLVNNATRGQLLSVLARTDPAGGARGFSLLLVDKRELAEGTYRHLPKVLTHGIRGADISGIAFDGARLPLNAVVGAPGQGLEILLKSLQITRTMCAALSLGMADHALRLAVDFALTHRLYGRRLIDLPHAGRVLAQAYADLLLAEAATIAATRGLHTLPGEMSVASAIVKSWVPATVDRMIAALSRLMGARALLTEDHADGRFQKVQRDHPIVAIFDGSTHVNLNALINQFGRLGSGELVDPALATAMTLSAPLPEFEPDRLRLLSRAGCSLVQSLPEAVGELPPALAVQGKQAADFAARLRGRLTAGRPAARGVPAEAFELARQYGAAYAAAAAMHLWLRNPPLRDGDWLGGCLARLSFGDAKELDRMLPRLLDQHARGRLFSLLPCALTGERRPADAR